MTLGGLVKKTWDWVSPVAALLSIVSFLMPQFMVFKKMRIVGTQSIPATEVFGNDLNLLMSITLIVFITSCFMNRSLYFSRISGLLAIFMIGAIFYFSGDALQNLPYDKTPYSRLSIGVGMWCCFLCYSTMIIKAAEYEINKHIGFIMCMAPIAIIIVLTMLGNLEHLGIVMEYKGYEEKFMKSVWQHSMISLGVIFFGILLGIPLGYLSSKSKKMESIIVPMINIIETVPTVSLITIVVIPLTIVSNKFPFLQQIGISGFGVTAPFIALVLYAIFPIIHNTIAAIRMINNEFIEVGKAIGMNKSQLFFKVKLPIAMPVMLAGIKISIVYSISGATLAAFIGGGGLGTFILQTDSMDFVLLGTLPIIGMTFLADTLLTFIIKKCSHTEVFQS